MLNLRDPTLLKDQGFVGGEWIGADSGETFEVADPATGARILAIPNRGAAETRRAIQAADKALPDWRNRTGKERSAIMTAEQGKPLAEAKGEIAHAAACIEWFAEEAKRV
jgi:succinate-semialdehyde dehydrogenase/glutarate-semialdehyde dehydrogenase